MDSEWMQLPANSLQRDTKQLRVVAMVAGSEQHLWGTGVASRVNFSTRVDFHFDPDQDRVAETDDANQKIWTSYTFSVFVETSKIVKTHMKKYLIVALIMSPVSIQERPQVPQRFRFSYWLLSLYQFGLVQIGLINKTASLWFLYK